MSEPKVVVDIVRLKTLMEGKGWGVSELSEATTLSYDLTYKIVNGKRPSPQARSIALIAQALNVSAAYLIGLAEHPEVPGADPVVVQIAQVTGKLGTQKKVEALRIARELGNIEDAEGQAVEELLAIILDLGGSEAHEKALSSFRSIASKT